MNCADGSLTDGEWIYEVIDDKLYMRVGDDDELPDADVLDGLLERGDADGLVEALRGED